VAVLLAYVNDHLWTWIAGDLYLPEPWFSPEYARRRQRVGLPPEHQFATKVQLAWQLIATVRGGPLPFAAVVEDAFYENSEWLRAQLDWAGVPYQLEVPRDLRVFLAPPEATARVWRGPAPADPTTKPAVKWRGVSLRLDALAQEPWLRWTRLRVRPTERGYLRNAATWKRNLPRWWSGRSAKGPWPPNCWSCDGTETERFPAPWAICLPTPP
jgi:hypothetical protein